MTTNIHHSAPIRAILHAEAAALAALGLWAYAQGGYGWGLFALLLLAPDLAMLGYLRGPRVGAFCYNLAHSYGAPLALLALGFWLARDSAIAVALIWVIHIALDRAIGYGLKYASGFRDTHFGRI